MKIIREELKTLPAGPVELRKFGLLVGGIFEFNLGDSEVLMLFLALLACGYVPKLERA